ncbi:hypothetical protein [Runella slithyformis]|uniref:Uncharacterized protein n=1 Tax=Runella slithyformis (strain ATCC 29530 / DSM 19594 / LMG 11500 / NCIMB 11436 / LSU 4) TaxID=761193 RepID=A0A7U4E4M6_RUNSL|nr:hypothetical protein [Runella slithyformis]AEI47681.1 hypothetical protein Runsl_1254 [Runella slithyformis DSM 19594]
MLFPRILNSSNVSLNGIPDNYDPAIPADTVDQSLTAFEVQKAENLRIAFDAAFKGVLSIGPNAATVNLKVNGAAFGASLAATNATVAGSDVTGSAANASLHFGDNLKVLRAGDVIDVSSFPAVGTVSLFLFDKQNVSNILNSFGYEFKLVDRTAFTINYYNGTGAANLRMTQAVTALTGTDKISIEIGEKTIVVKRNTTVLDTIPLKYKATLKNEAGTAVDANAGVLKLSSDTAYANTLVDADTEIMYVVGDVLGGYNVEIESEIGRKILQKVIVVDKIAYINPFNNLLPVSFTESTENNESPVSFWNRYKTLIVIGGIVLGVSLLAAYLIQKLSK